MNVIANRGLRILCPNGHLGFAPTREGSFNLGLAEAPDMLACDSGSSDCGPVPLGSDTCASPLAWQEHDIELMLLGGRRLGAPVIIGSAGGTRPHSRGDRYIRIGRKPAARSDRYIGIVRKLAAKHGLRRFKLGWFYSELTREQVRARLRPSPVCGLD